MSKKTIYRIFIHAVFWAIYVFGYAFIASYGRGDFTTQAEMHLLYVPVVMAATYFTIYILIPKFLLRKKYLQLAVYFILSFLIFGFIERLNIMFIVIPAYFPDMVGQYEVFSFRIITRTMDTYYVVFVASAVKLVKHWYNNQQLAQQLHKEKLESELNFLKSQIHPHFLFNTLNNLYVLTMKKSGKAPEIVLKLSDLLSFMLYECNSQYIPLQKEIDNIENYIELERLRHGSELEIDYKKTIEDESRLIAPLLLLPLIENAFKHGVSKGTDTKIVNISISLEDSMLVFFIENSVEKENIIENENKGIGIINLQRRLELLYKDCYELDIKKLDSVFRVELKLNLITNSNE